MLWKLRLGLFLFCIVVLAVANVIYVVIETQTHHAHLSPKVANGNDDPLPHSRLRDTTARVLQSTARPCDDFYNYTCASHGYLEDVLAHVRRDNRQRIEHLIKDNKRTTDVSRLYASCEAYKMTPTVPTSMIIASLLTKVSSIRSYDDLAYLWGQLQLYDVDTPLDFIMLTNPWDTRYNLPTFEQSGLFDDPERLEDEDHRHDIEQRLSSVYPLADAREWSEVVVEMEQTIYSIFNDDYRESFLQYLSTHGQRDLLYDWQAYTSDSRFNVTKYLLGCKPNTTMTDHEWMRLLLGYPLWCRAQEYMSSLPSVIVKYPLQAWLAYTRYAILMLYDIPASTYGTTESVLTTIMPMIDMERHHSLQKKNVDCVMFVSEWLNTEIVQLYTDEYVDTDVIYSVRVIAHALQEVFVRFLSDQPELQKKVAALTMYIGDTDARVQRTWNLSGVFIDDFLRLRRERVSARLLGMQVDVVLPIHIGARYRHQANALDISVGLLRDPLFSFEQTRTETYAQMATIIGHELAHSIDMIGVNFNEHGNYAPMSYDTTQMIVHTQDCLQAAYEYGTYTRNEDFADVVGVNLAYWVLMSAPETSDDDRRQFFEAYTQRFCRSPLTHEQEAMFVKKSTHSLSKYRVNSVLRSNTDFNAIYACDSETSVDKCINLF